MKKNLNFKKNRFLPSMAALALIGTGALVYAGTASASTGTPSSITASTMISTRRHEGGHRFGKGSGISGTVTAVNGTIITITGKNSTTYTVDATNAKIEKITPPVAGTTSASASSTWTRPTPTTITVSQVSVGDTLMVQGTVSGTSVTATNIIDGKFGGFGGRGTGSHTGTASPRVGGTVTAVNGNSITVTNAPKSGTPVVYTVDVSNAKITQRGAKGTTPTTITPSAITVGERVMVRGTVGGTSVTATNVTVMPATTVSATATSTQ